MAVTGERIAERFEGVVRSKAELRELYGEPAARAVEKDIGRLDEHCQEFLARSPFMLLGTCGEQGRCDVSPKGDGPGFVLVLDEKTIAIPDRLGNRRIDSLQNIVENPHVGLLFVVPGMNETLRVNGSAQLVRDEALLERLAVEGKRPNLAIVVSIEECYLHCAKSFLRARLWDPERFIDRSTYPSLARIVEDHRRRPGTSDGEHERAIAEREEQVAEAYRCLY
jgi:PPOX class probable FMN-dependent enzyme